MQRVDDARAPAVCRRVRGAMTVLACAVAVAASWLDAGGARAQDATAAVAAEIDAASCSNGHDDDGDGMSDCADPACRIHPFCAPAAPIAAPPPTHVRTHSLVALQVAGAVSWGIVYLVGIGITAGVGGSAEEIGLNAIPLAGPWLCFALCDNPGPYAPGLITSGSLQALGFLLLVIGSAVQLEEREPLAVELVPWLGPTLAGAAVELRL